MAAGARQTGRRSDDAVEGGRTRLIRRAEAPNSPALYRGCVAVAAQDPKQQVVLPFAGNAEILAGVAFLLEPGPREQRAAGGGGRATRSFEPMQPEPLECKVDDLRQRRRHITLPCKGLTHPVAQAPRLRNGAAN